MAEAPVVTSPVPGINVELASLLITAIKTRRKLLSKSFSNEQQERLHALKENADDSTTMFLVRLRKEVEAAKRKQSPNIDRDRHTNAATHCLGFLLQTLSETGNSFHLRRAAMLICREILQRSSDARAYLDSDGILMDFVSMVQKMDDEEEETSNPVMSPSRIFRQDAIDLITYLSDKFGTLYPKFIVSERLMSEISTFTSIQSSNEPNQRTNMMSLRTERDIALQKGMKACDVLERMIGKADGYFRLLVPRYGGFVNESDNGEVQQISSCENLVEEEVVAERSNILLDGSACNRTEMSNKEISHNNFVETFEDDDASIEWEEGDADCFNDEDSPRGNLLTEIEETGRFDTDHHTAVAHTLGVMQQSGVIREGGLSVELGPSVQNSKTTLGANNRGSQIKLKKLVDDLKSQRLPQLNKWVHALSHADGMEERTVEDPSNAGGGPVSLTLLSAEKRALRASLLKRMLKIKGDAETTIQSANLLSAITEEELQHSNTNQEASAPTNNPEAESGAARKRVWLSTVAMARKPAVKKSRRYTKFGIFYHKK